jgi:serine protease Do
LLAFSSCTIVYTQKTPESPKPADKAPKPSVWNFQFDGGGSYLGVEPQDVTRDNLGKFGLSEVRGVGVEKVLENSPAAAAGLQAGDVIVKFDGEELASVRKLTRLIAEVAPDHRVRLTILRGGSERELTVTMGRRDLPQLFNGEFRPELLPNLESFPKMPNLPNAQIMPKMPAVPVTPDGKGDVLIWKNDGDNTFFFGSNRQIGVGVSSLTKQLGDYFGVPEGRGLLVTSVRENSPAAKAGLKAGDIILEAEGKEVKGNLDLVRAVNEKKEGEVTLTIIRDKNRQTVRVTPEAIKGDFAPLFEGKLPEMNYQMTQPPTPAAPVQTVAPTVRPAAPRRIL